MADIKPLVLYSGEPGQLQSGDKLPISAIASGTADGTKFVKDDGTLAAIPLNYIVGATGATTINNGLRVIEWQWNNISGSGFKITSSSTDAATNSQKLLEVSLSGVNSNSNQRTISANFSNTHSGTGSINIASYMEASGGTLNVAGWFKATGTGAIAMYVEDGIIGIGPFAGSGTRMVMVGADGTLFPGTLPTPVTAATDYDIDDAHDNNTDFVSPKNLSRSHHGAASALFNYLNFS